MSAENIFHVPSLVALIASVIAAATSVFVALMSKKSQHALAELQGNLQKELAEQQEKLQKDLNAINDMFERERGFVGFRRERIARHLDQVMEAYIDIYATGEFVVTENWFLSNTDYETEVRFRSSLSRLRVHFGALEILQVVSKDICTEFVRKDKSVLDAWNAMLAEAAIRTREFREKHPDYRMFSTEEFWKKWSKYKKCVENLGAIIKDLSSSISLPK